MKHSHSTPTDGRPFPLPRIGTQDRLRHLADSAVRNLKSPRRSDGALAAALAGIAVELLSPRSLSDSILMILDGGRAATMQDLARILRRRKQTVIHTVRALEHAGQIKKRGRKWIRAEEQP